jgi:hypothetical protein
LSRQNVVRKIKEWWFGPQKIKARTKVTRELTVRRNILVFKDVSNECFLFGLYFFEAKSILFYFFDNILFRQIGVMAFLKINIFLSIVNTRV